MVEKMQEGRRTGVRRPSDSHSPGLRSGRSIQSLEDGPGCLDAGGASLGQAAGDARAVAGGKEDRKSVV